MRVRRRTGGHYPDNAAWCRSANRAHARAARYRAELPSQYSPMPPDSFDGSVAAPVTAPVARRAPMALARVRWLIAERPVPYAVAVAVVLAFVAHLMVGSVPAVAALSKDSQAMLFAAIGIVFGLVMLVVLVRGGVSLAALGLHAPDQRDAAAGLRWLVGIGAMYGAVGVVVWLASGLEAHAFAAQVSPAPTAGIVLLYLVRAPLVEELIFRGVLYSALRERAGPVQAVVMSALVFAVAHTLGASNGVNGAALANWFLGGLVFATAYERTGALWVPMALHAAGNGALLLLGAWAHTGVVP